jgi:hypothetical protein
MDIHPVAVLLAHVTYILALAPVLSARKGPISIPVYVGDVCQVTVQSYHLMRETAELGRLLMQVNCRITSIIRRRDAGAISEREAEQELKQCVAFRAETRQRRGRGGVANDWHTPASGKLGRGLMPPKLQTRNTRVS